MNKAVSTEISENCQDSLMIWPFGVQMDLLVNAKQTFTEALLNLGDPASTTKSLKARGIGECLQYSSQLNRLMG